MVTARETAADESLLSLSDLVNATGVPASTVHHYLKGGLIPPPTRSALNRFRYDERHVTALRLIRLLRERKGLGLDEIAAKLPDLLSRPDVLAWVAEEEEAESDVAGRIVDAAIKSFQTNSFSEVTVADVAELAGVAKGSVYRYFASKEELFTAAVEQVLASTATDFARAIERLGGAEGVASTPDRTAEEFAGLAAGAMPMLLELGTRAAKGDLPSEALSRRVLRTLAEAIGRPLIKSDEPEGQDAVTKGLAVIQTAFSVMLTWAVGPDWPPDERLETPPA
jgi:AcrR family transcriptional regulator/predicted DNA-binding transcriptional regulator AlpA